ncbi:MAG TPA: hypothetical protein VHL58_06835 [Thermoanaerobaculia bacterium]|nr:hypothetical protein [Thermoanaerobaculia bacterium]
MGRRTLEKAEILIEGKPAGLLRWRRAVLREVSAKRFVDRFGVAKHLSYVGREKDDVRTTHVSLVILAANSTWCGGLQDDNVPEPA